mmetsp:Transcript_28748/g.51406  ORF Transcript_28748/g.51406 Transcript_28748/m.51406 type:complete len:274 (+) Transcript_28748:2565-3386(+)
MGKDVDAGEGSAAGISNGDGSAGHCSKATTSNLGSQSLPGLVPLTEKKSEEFFVEFRRLAMPESSLAQPETTDVQELNSRDWEDGVQLEQCIMPGCQNKACPAGQCLGINCTCARCAECEGAAEDKLLCNKCTQAGVVSFYGVAKSSSGDIQYASIVAQLGEVPDKLLFTARQLGNNDPFPWAPQPNKKSQRRSMHIFAFVRRGDGKLRFVRMGEDTVAVRMDAALSVPRSSDTSCKLGPALKLARAGIPREYGTTAVPKIAIDSSFLQVLWT